MQMPTGKHTAALTGRDAHHQDALPPSSCLVCWSLHDTMGCSALPASHRRVMTHCDNHGMHLMAQAGAPCQAEDSQVVQMPTGKHTTAHTGRDSHHPLDLPPICCLVCRSLHDAMGCSPLPASHGRPMTCRCNHGMHLMPQAGTPRQAQHSRIVQKPTGKHIAAQTGRNAHRLIVLPSRRCRVSRFLHDTTGGSPLPAIHMRVMKHRNTHGMHLVDYADKITACANAPQASIVQPRQDRRLTACCTSHPSAEWSANATAGSGRAAASACRAQRGIKAWLHRKECVDAHIHDFSPLHRHQSTCFTWINTRRTSPHEVQNCMAEHALQQACHYHSQGAAVQHG